MDFDSLFQTLLFSKHMHECVVAEKIGRVKKSTGRFTWTFNKYVHDWASG